MPVATPLQWILSSVLVLSSLGVVLAYKPVYASLSFLLTLLMLAALYLELSAQFISVMQVLVYAGAILVLFMFVIVLFQDAHVQIEKHRAQSTKLLLIVAGCSFALALIYLGSRFLALPAPSSQAAQYGTVEALGALIYTDFFFPFEAVILLFLVAIIGSLYIGKKGD